MKGIQVTRFGTAEVLEYGELAEPAPDSDQILIEVHGASVNFADTRARSGGYHLGKKPPFCPGLDIAGVVLEAGDAVTGIAPGDHVIAFPTSGAYAEKAVASRDLTFVIPETLDFTKAAAAALVAGTVTHMLKYLARIEADESLLVHTAAGGVGTTALQVAGALGVSRLYGSIGSPWKAEHVKKMGATDVVDYRSDSYAADILELTDGRGVDVILNPLGGVTIQQDLNCLAPFGRLVVFGELSGDASTIEKGSLYTANRTIIGSSFGHYRKNRPAAVRETMATVIDLLASGAVEVFVHASLPLEKAADAHRMLEDRQALGKIVLVP